MNVKLEERDVKAVHFSLDGYDDAKLFAEATKFLEELKSDPHTWLLLGMNRQSDDFGSHLTLFLERRPVTQARPPKTPTDTASKDPIIRYLT